MSSTGGLSRRELLRQAATLAGLGAAGALRGALSAPVEAATEIPVKGGVLKVATIGDPPTVDAHQTTAIITAQVTQEVYETLFALDAAWQPQPLLAAGAHWSNGNLTLTIPLRTDVVFHNGAPMTAADVVASVQRWLRLAALGQTIAPGIRAVTARDAHTVIIDLHQPAGSLLSALSNPNNIPAIIPKSIVDQYGDKPISAPVGTGPYRFQEWRPDVHIRLVRFEGYRPVTTPASGYAGRRIAYLDEIRFIPVPEANTRMAGMQTGEFDFAIQLPSDLYAQVKANPNFVPLIVKPYGWPIFVFNKKKSLFANLKVRVAFLKALDNRPIMEAAIGPKEFWSVESPTIAYGAFTDNATGADVFNHQDVGAAKALLREAGYDGKPIRFMATKDYDLMYQSALVAKGQLEAAGFKVDLQVVDWATLVQRRNNPDLYDVFTTYAAFVPADPTAGNAFVSEKWPGWWADAKKDAALQQLVRNVAPEARRDAWSQIQALFYQDVPAVKIGDFYLLNVSQKWVRGFQNTPDLFFWNVWLAKR